IPGRATPEIFAEILPQAIRSLSFDKTMRWGSSRMRFARPIRWIVALLGGEVVPFEIEGVSSGNRSRGHRFYAPAEFKVKDRSDLLQKLRKAKVEPDPAAREAQIRSESAQVASGEVVLDPTLVEENVYLTEWPSALEGTFGEEYLGLPEPVLVTAMAKHERFFPVRSSNGQLMNRFISIRNAGVDEVVRDGNEWVLNARFNDAKFFYDEDLDHSLDEFLERTSGIVFQEKLGTVRQRADRLEALAGFIARGTGAGEDEQEWARLAARYAKADLSSGLVSELASLQGVIGGEYARREGMPEAVCAAIGAHYDLRKAGSPETPEGRTALRLLIADQLDKLAGYLGLGLMPSGSSDPFGLRRSASMLIETAWLWPEVRSLQDWFGSAIEGFEAQGFDLNRSKAFVLLEEILRSRYEALLPEARHDLVEAVLGADVTAPRRVRFRISVMKELAADTEFVYTATRPINIVRAAQAKGIQIPTAPTVLGLNLGRLDSEEGEQLWPLVSRLEGPLAEALSQEDSTEVVRFLKELEGPINAFFDSTMIMVDEVEVRAARLALLNAIATQLALVGDFTKIVIPGDATRT
ncbi:MAG TPA: glycine--tRNA ligase subunit beta, partial [Fimbriimonadaceae bacterium]|nr:glycine--tRNA ligase subunit beta [Fimbriimonadaceae bacterium]